MRNCIFLFFSTAFWALLLLACERPVPADQYFCKSEEVYVLKTPFEPETAIIVMHKGDDVFLLGDTAYAPTPDSAIVDSSDFYVKVKAKRGVVGWIYAAELQHERPQAPPAKPAAPVKIAPKPKVVPKDTLAELDSLLRDSDSLRSSYLGTYVWKQDSIQQYHLSLLAYDSSGWQLRWHAEGRCDTSLKARATIRKATLNWQVADSCIYRLQLYPSYKIEVSGDSCLQAACWPSKATFIRQKPPKIKSDSSKAKGN